MDRIASGEFGAKIRLNGRIVPRFLMGFGHAVATAAYNRIHMTGDRTIAGNCTELPDAEYIFGSTVGMQAIRAKIDLALKDDLPILIEGESGTGKEVVGRYLHTSSVRHQGPFIKVSCGAIPAALLKGEMFGCGPAIGAENRMGSIDMASGGTLFLDEIQEMDLGLQQLLAQSIADGCYWRQKVNEAQSLNTRLIFASSIDLERARKEGTVAPDLLEQAAHRLRLLPLRERKEDIPEICGFLAEKFARNFGRPVPHLSRSVLRAFSMWNWPGNIRELENWMARIVIFGTEEAIGLEFSRQLGAWIDAAPRLHHAARAKGGRPRKARRF